MPDIQVKYPQLKPRVEMHRVIDNYFKNKKMKKHFLLSALILSITVSAQQKPNIVVIMGDDVGIWNIGAYSRGMMAGKTPHLDKLAAEGMLFTDYYAESSCTA